VAFAIAEGADLFEPRGLADRRSFRHATGGGFHRFSGTLRVPRKNPLFAAVRSAAQEHRQLTADRCQQHDIYRASGPSDFAVGHRTRELVTSCD
jgi:hypothetical protein